MSDWTDYDLTIGMPHLAPNRLSEVELLKWLAVFQWESISRALGTPSSAIANAQNERLYASFISFDLRFPERRSIDVFDEGSKVAVHNRIGSYAGRFIEGLFAFDTEPVPAADLARISTPAELATLECPTAYATNAFVARAGSNAKLKVFEPQGIGSSKMPVLSGPPTGIAEHQAVQSTGRVAPFEEVAEIDLGGSSNAITYKIAHESDMNGAGLLYFARYVAIMNYGERRFLSEHLERPLSRQAIDSLAVERRRIFFFVNADPSDSVRIFLRAHFLPHAATAPQPGRRSLGKIAFRHDLHRASDGVLMASSLVRKSINVFGHEKDVVNEIERMKGRLAVR